MECRYVSRRDDGILVDDYGDMEVMFPAHIEQCAREHLYFYELDPQPQDVLVLTPKLRAMNVVLGRTLLEEWAFMVRRTAWVCPETLAFVMAENIIRHMGELWDARLFATQQEALAFLKS